jgi:hypothetical protein
MKYLLLVLPFIFYISCGQSSTTTNTNQLITNYTNACCCNTIFNVGIGKIFIPSMFTPNSDGLNDQFRIYGDSNIKFIVDVTISNSTTFTSTFDTIYGGQTNNSWSGMLNNNIIFEGNFNCSFKVIDKANSIINFSGSSASFIKTTHAFNFISNYANCKFEDQLDFATFSLPYLTNETKFQ